MFVYFGYGIKNSVLEQPEDYDGREQYDTSGETLAPTFDSRLTPNYRPSNGQQNNFVNSLGHSLRPTVSTNPFLSSESPDLELKIPANRFTSIQMQPRNTYVVQPFSTSSSSAITTTTTKPIKPKETPPAKPPPPTRAYSKPEESSNLAPRRKPPPVPPRPSLDRAPQPLQRQQNTRQQLSLDRPNWETFE